MITKGWKKIKNKNKKHLVRAFLPSPVRETMSENYIWPTLSSIAMTSVNNFDILAKEEKISSRQMYHMLYLNCKCTVFFISNSKWLIKVGRKKVRPNSKVYQMKGTIPLQMKISEVIKYRRKNIKSKLKKLIMCVPEYFL